MGSLRIKGIKTIKVTARFDQRILREIIDPVRILKLPIF